MNYYTRSIGLESSLLVNYFAGGAGGAGGVLGERIFEMIGLHTVFQTIIQNGANITPIANPARKSNMIGTPFRCGVSMLT